MTTRCTDGRLMKRTPASDDPYLETDIGKCPECDGKGCVKGCQRCGDEDCSPNVEAFELSGECVCDECAEEIFEENSQFGVGS